MLCRQSYHSSVSCHILLFAIICCRFIADGERKADPEVFSERIRTWRAHQRIHTPEQKSEHNDHIVGNTLRQPVSQEEETDFLPQALPGFLKNQMSGDEIASSSSVQRSMHDTTSEDKSNSEQRAKHPSVEQGQMLHALDEQCHFESAPSNSRYYALSIIVSNMHLYVLV